MIVSAANCVPHIKVSLIEAMFLRAPLRASQQGIGSIHFTLRQAQRRWLATPAGAADGKLPLAGIKVLDMTRVLAGVSFLSIHMNFPRLIKYSHTARRFWET